MADSLRYSHYQKGQMFFLLLQQTIALVALPYFLVGGSISCNSYFCEDAVFNFKQNDNNDVNNEN